MTYDHSFEDNARGYALSLAAGGIARYLTSTSPQVRDMVPLDLNIDTVLDFLDSARKGLEAVCGSYEGDNFHRDMRNIDFLDNACPELGKIQPKERYSKLKAYLASLEHLKLGRAVDEDVKDELVSLCRTIAAYTSSQLSQARRFPRHSVYRRSLKFPA